MKTGLRTMSLTAAAFASFASFALADAPTAVTDGADVSNPPTQHRSVKFKQIREKKMAERAAVLELTDAQQSQIKAITAAARQANEPMRQKLVANQKQIKALSNVTPLDESALRSLIAGNEAVKTELAISRIKIRNQIQALLTPEQQAKAKELSKLTSNKHHEWGGSRGI
jgi:Spy/CpxP family protein refolding chaperone